MRSLSIVIIISCALLGSINEGAVASNSVLRSDEKGSSEEKMPTSTKVLRSDRYNLSEDKRSSGGEWLGFTRLIQHGELYVGMMAKIGVVRGIYEGAWTIDPEKCDNMYYNAGSYRMFVNGLDSFYSDKQNLNIPIAEAMKIISMRLRSIERSKTSKALGEMRSIYPN